ncbi:ABC transporter permease [uncultured Tateyamaria sp.]|uniref:ABC transporter permease n=1 Tax=uncultured Tateyamaria sp. TaxID=455651 RepID=UPI0026392C77|nr:ABC transporter permease [uncultured Tateyamaria sp.]
MNKISYLAGVTAFGLTVWQGTVWIAGVPHFILPSPRRVAQVGWENRVLIGENALVTGFEVAMGLVLGVLLGAVTAVQLARSDRLYRLVMPLLVFTQAVPVFALAPILTLWLGYGMASKVMMAILIIYFPVTSAFYDGLTRVPQDVTDMARTMNGTNWQVMWRIRIPHALPSLATGLKLAAVYAPLGAVIGEWVGASRGLGYLMLLANGRAKTDLMFARLVVLAIMTIGLHLAVKRAALRMQWE